MAKQLPRIGRVSLVDEVVSAIQKMLSEDAWSPGAKLPSEQELARQLGVGRSTVREALRVLGHLGLVESKSGLGTFVINRQMPAGGVERPLTPKGLLDLYEFRHALEVPAARLAAERRSESQFEDIVDAWRVCIAEVERNHLNGFARGDFGFHFSVVRASANDFYVEAYRGIESAFIDYVRLVLGQGPLRSMLHFHDNLIAAIERKDPEAATQAVEENFAETDVRVLFLARNQSSNA